MTDLLSFEQIMKQAYEQQRLIYVQLKNGNTYEGYISALMPNGFFLHFPKDEGFIAVMLEMVNRIFVFHHDDDHL